MPYRPASNGLPARAIAYLRGLPPGESITEQDLAIAMRERRKQVRARLKHAIAAGFIRNVDGCYMAGEKAPQAFGAPRAYRRQRRVVGVEVHEARRLYRGSLREMLMSGALLDVGNPLRELADMMDAARDVVAAKTTSRFSTAEVDVVVARELRAVMDTVGRATSNLRKMLEIM